MNVHELTIIHEKFSLAMFTGIYQHGALYLKCTKEDTDPSESLAKSLSSLRPLVKTSKGVL